MKPVALHWLAILAHLLLSGTAAWSQQAPATPSANRLRQDRLVLEPQAPLSGRLIEEDPALSPDGLWLAYTTEEQGNRDIWIRPVEPGVMGELPVRVTDHPAPDWRPAWSEDGRFLLFISNRDDALGDIWRVRVKTRFGELVLGKAENVLKRPGAQDNPVQRKDGSLYWDESDAGGQRILGRRPLLPPAEVAAPARRLRVAGDTLFWLAPRADGHSGLFRHVGDVTEELWSPPGGVLDFEPGPEGGLWLCGLRTPLPPRPTGTAPGARHRGMGERRAMESRTGAGLWMIDRGGLPHELVPASTDPRQVSVRPVSGLMHEARLVTTEGRERPGLWLLGGWGRLAPADSPEDLEALFSRNRDNEMGDLVLSRLRQDFPGTPAAERAALEELRRVLADTLSTPHRFRKEADLRWTGLSSADARLRFRGLAGLALFTDPIPEARGDSLARLQFQFADSLARTGHPGPAAEALLALARRQQAANRPDACLLAVLRLEERAADEPERADALLLKVWAHQRLGQEDAAFGSLEELVRRFPGRADLLRHWFQGDRVRLDSLDRTPALRELQGRLARLGRVREFRQAWLVELARREAMGSSGLDAAPVALEDLELVLAQERAECGAFESWVMTEARVQKALILKQIGQLDAALDLLALVPPWSDEEGRNRLVELRLQLRMERGQQALRSGHPALAEADFRRVRAEQPGHIEALRGWVEAQARSGLLPEVLPELRLAAEADSAQAIDFHALGLALSWLSETQPASLPESDYWLQRALAAAPRTVRPWQTLAWNLTQARHLQLTRPEGLASLLSQVENSRELVNRWRWEAQDRNPEELLDRAVFLLQRALDLSRLENRPDLEAELSWNLGNLYFARGEFGAAQSLAAYERAQASGLEFHDPHQRLAWLEKLGIARQWNGHYEGAVQALDSAQQLAAQLGEGAQQRMLLGRLAHLHSGENRWNESLATWERALALESNPGQQALILRNRASCLIELGELDAARQDLARSATLLEDARWPLKPRGNWLRIKLLGLNIPLWNFKNLYTGSGRLHWLPEDEALLRQALLARIEGLEGRPDRLLASLNQRRRLLRRQGDTEGMVRMDLAIAAFQARAGRPGAGAARFGEARRLAADNALGMGLEAQALVGELQCRLLAGQPDAAGKGLPGIETLLTRLEAGETMPRRQRLELACLQSELLLLDPPATGSGLLGLLDTAPAGFSGIGLEDLERMARAMDALEAIDPALQPALPDRFQWYLAKARVHLALAEPKQAARTLDQARTLLGPDPGESAWAQSLEAVEADIRRQAPALLKTSAPDAVATLQRRLENDLLLSGQDTQRQLQWNRILEQDRDALLAAGDSATARDRELWLRWWHSRQPFARKGLKFPEENQTNLWNNWLADREERDALEPRLAAEEQRLAALWAEGITVAPGAVATGRLDGNTAADSSLWKELDARRIRLDGWLSEDRTNLSRDPRLALLASASALPLDSLGQWPADGVHLMGSGGPQALAGRHCADPRQLETMAAAAGAGGDYISWCGPREGWPAADSLRTSGADSLLASGAAREGRVLALDGVLNLDPGLPLGAWFELGGQRVELRRLMEKEWLAESLVLRGIRVAGDSAPALDGWLCLERMLALGGIRRLVCPQPGREAGREELLAMARQELYRPGLNEADVNRLVLGAAALDPDTRHERALASLERRVRLGNQHLKDGNGERAWHQFRQALELSLRLGLNERSQALLELAARSADTGPDAARMAGPALDRLRSLSAAVPSPPEIRGRLLARLVLLADLAGRETTADSLWAECAPLLEPTQRASFTDRRLKHLSDQHQPVAAATLAARHQCLPAEGEGRRALFLAKVYLEGEQAPEALRCFQWPGLDLAQLDSAARLDWLELQAVAHLRTGGLEAAAALLDSSLRLQQRMSDPDGRLALTYLRRADLAWEQGLNSQAFLELAEARPRIADTETGRLMLWENSSGLVRHGVGELPEAIGHFERALEHARSLGDHREQSAITNNLARSLTRLGRPELALERLAEAARQDSLGAARLNHVATLRNRAEALLATGTSVGSTAAALDAAQEALGLAVTLGATTEEGRCLEVLAKVQLARGEHKALAATAQRMASLASDRGIETLRWKALLRRGQARELDGKRKEAEEDFTAASREWQALAARQSGVRFRSGMDSEQQELVTARLRVLVDGGELERALLVADRAHGRGFEDLLALRDHRLPADSGQAALRDSLMQALTDTQNSLSREDRPDRLQTLRHTYENQRQALDRLLLAQEAGESTSGTPSARPALLRETDQLKALQAALAPADLVLLYQLGPERSLVFCMGRDTLGLRVIDGPGAELETLAEEHRSRILGLLSAGGSGQELWNRLLGPELAARPGTKRLFVIGHGALHRLPFASLQDEAGEPLIARCSLLQLPSLGLLDWCRQTGRIDGPGLVLANPVDSGLDFAGLEAQAMRAAWPTLQVKEGPRAEEAVLTEDATPRRFRHFSCHGVMDPLSPAASGLLLTPGRGADGRLSATEISTLTLPTDLVMLSACDTGLGRSQGGDEVAGLPRAFIVAGARQVVSSLWKVDDLSTAVLVKHFYRNLAAGQDSAEALRRAMLEVRRVLNPHPAYWAAFTLAGWPGMRP